MLIGAPVGKPAHRVRSGRAVRTSHLVAGALAAALALPALIPTQAAADPTGVQVGVLSCHEKSGWGFVFGSSRGINCTFTHGDHADRYTGDISKFGVDVGYQQSAVLVWAVFSPTDRMGPGDLHGHYGGVTASAAVGVGAGGNALIGGSDHSFTLQPVSIQGDTGLNVAAGIGEMTLHHVPMG